MSHQLETIFLLINRKRYALAEEELGKVIVKDPNNGNLYAVLALCLMMQGKEKMEAALSAAQKGLGLNPYSAYCHYMLGKVFWEQNKLVKALEHLHQALAIEPNDEDYLYAYAAIRFQQERYEECLSIVNQILNVNAEHIDRLAGKVFGCFK